MSVVNNKNVSKNLRGEEIKVPPHIGFFRCGTRSSCVISPFLLQVIGRYYSDKSNSLYLLQLQRTLLLKGHEIYQFCKRFVILPNGTIRQSFFMPCRTNGLLTSQFGFEEDYYAYRFR